MLSTYTKERPAIHQIASIFQVITVSIGLAKLFSTNILKSVALYGFTALVVLSSVSVNLSTYAAASKITVMALMQDKAILMIDGSRRVLRVGDISPEQVKLISANTSSAVVEISGSRETLQAGMVVTPVDTKGDSIEVETSEGVVLWQEGDGFFRATGTIDGHEVRFLVDTGANIVALNQATAQAAGLDLSKGQLGIATTASGRAKMVKVIISELKIGDLTAYDVEAGVIFGAYPKEPLLGQSFLSSVKMNRAGDRLALEPLW